MGQELFNRFRTILLVFFIIKLALVLSFPAVLAQEADASGAAGDADSEIEEEVVLPDAGTTPDSPFYGLDLAMERLGTAFAFGKAAKAERKLNHAEERLSEVRKMVEKNKLGAAERARTEHVRKLQEVEDGSKDKGGGVDDARRGEIKRRIIQNRIHAERVSDAMEMRMRLLHKEKKLSQEELEKLETFLASLAEENAAFDDADDADDSADSSISKFKAERVAEQISEAAEEIEEAEEELAEFGDAASRTEMINTARRLIGEAKEKLANAETAFKEEKYGMAFGQATAAKMLAKNAQRILERAGSSDDENDDDSDNGREEIKIKIITDARDELSRADINANFYIEFKDRQDLIDKILKELALSPEQVGELLKVEDEDLNQRNQERKKLEMMVKAKDGIAKIDFRMRFFMNTAEKTKASSEISSALTSLTASDLTDALTTNEMVRKKEVQKMNMKLRERLSSGNEREIEIKDESGDEDEEDEEGDSNSTSSNSSGRGRGRGRD